MFWESLQKNFCEKGLTRQRNLAIMTVRQCEIAKTTKEAMHKCPKENGLFITGNKRG